MSELDYLDDALCAQVDPALWFPDNGGRTPARGICAKCPVQAECLEDALTQEVNPWGVWAGTTERQRAKMRRIRERGDAA